MHPRTFQTKHNNTSLPGTYVLVVYMRQDAKVSIGRLGSFRFPTGYYLYVGSARGPGGLEARVARHLRRRKQPHWHIDYLLQEASVVEVWKAASTRQLECLWADAMLSMPNAKKHVPGFGSSDCGCPTHLIHFSSLPSLDAFARLLSAFGSEVKPCRQNLAEPEKAE